VLALETLLLAAALAAGNDTVLLQFSSEHCGPCKTMAPVVRRLSQDGYPVRQIDVDQERDLATHFRVTGVPCFVLISGEKEIDRVVGATSYDRLTQMFQKVKTQPAKTEAKQVRGQSPDSAAPRTGGPDLLQRLSDRESTRAGERQPVAVDPDYGPAVAKREGPAAQERAMQATVRLRIDEGKSTSFGTGTIIDTHGSEALVLTCGHIFRDSQGKGPISVEMCSGASREAMPGHLIGYDLKRDVALVSIRPPAEVGAIQVAPPSYKAQRGTRVFSVGCDHGKEARLAQSRVTAIDKYVGPANVEVSGAPAVGRSGGGLFSEEGYLIGVCNAADPADNEGIYAALPSIHWQLSQIGQSAIYERAEMAIARERAAQPLVDDVASRREAEPPPGMADQMPSKRDSSPAGADPRPNAAGDDDTEVIFIVRSKKNPQAPGETFVLDRPSPEFMSRLSQEYQGSGLRGRSAVAETATRPPGPRGSVRAQSADR
jgi:thiol-disulfide isomerase/thioredoxin